VSVPPSMSSRTDREIPHPETTRRLLARADVLDCAAVLYGGLANATVETMVRHAVAYIVPGPHADHAAIRRGAAAVAVAVGHPVHVVLVDHIPRTEEGCPDLTALAEIPVLSPALIREYETACNNGRTGSPVRVGIAQLRPTRGRFQLADFAVPSSDGSRGDPRSSVVTPVHLTPAVPADAQQAISTGGELSIDPSLPRTLPDALLSAARQHPDRGLYLVSEPDRVMFLPYPVLLDRALRILGGLHERGVHPGDPVLVQVAELDDYFPALWACLLGGIRPATIARPPGYNSPNAVLDKLHRAWRTLASPVIIGGSRDAQLLAGTAELYGAPGPQVLAVDELERSDRAAPAAGTDPAGTAFLQLSSGSTAASKVIAVTHRGVREYVAAAGAQQLGPEDVTVNWLPLDHVAGLLMFHMRDVLLGLDGVHIPTALVLQDPLLWLDLLERHHAAHSWSPNFGYKLVVEALRTNNSRHWDLSAVKTLINAGEQCTLPVMRDFLAATKAFGLRPSTLLSAWGMAETCTAIAYRRFSEPGAVQRITKVSLAGLLTPASDDVSDANCATFLSLGHPDPGAEFRIVGEDGQYLAEWQIGRLQVRSGRITPGYVNNPEANTQAFIGDGWFDTGDLGFLADGALTITGRRKEVIIINGTHYFCHELEDVIGSIPGVQPSFVASCGTPDQKTGTERLVVCYSPQDPAQLNSPDTVREVRRVLAERFQLSSAVVVPVPIEQFPKTTSGKIQRAEVRRRLLDGEFDDLLGRLDSSDRCRGSVPDCVYRRVWEARIAPEEPAGPIAGTTVVVADELGLADALIQLGIITFPVRVQAADAFAAVSSDHYHFNLGDRSHWELLFADLNQRGTPPDRVIYLTSYLPPVSVDVVGAAEKMIRLCGESLVHLLGAFGDQFNERPIMITSASRGLYLIDGTESGSFPASLTASLAVVTGLEWPHARIRHVDLAGRSTVEDATALAIALDGGRDAELDDVVTAWRAGRRYVRRLAPVRPRRVDPDVPSIVEGGCYLVTGGLGGVGAVVLPELLRRHQIRVLIVGRAPKTGDRVDTALAALRRHGGQVGYRSQDITDAAGLAATVAKAERSWGRCLDGVLHLAGTYRMRLVIEEDASSWRDGVAAKTIGALNLIRLLVDRPQARLVSFSSLLAEFPAVGTGAYVAANHFLEALHEHLSTTGRARGVCLSWGLWAGIGINRDNRYEEAVSRRGVLRLRPAEGRGLSAIMLAQPDGCYLVGVDATQPMARFHLRPDRPTSLEHPVLLAQDGTLPDMELPPLRDLFGSPVEVAVSFSEGGPQPTEDTAVTQQIEPTQAPELNEAGGSGIDYTTALRVVQDVMTQVLGDRIDERKTFFELGLDSIELLRTTTRLGQALRRELPQTTLFQYPTVQALVEHLAERPRSAFSHLNSRDSGTAENVGADDVVAADRRVAIIGMAGRFPGAESLNAFWRNLCAGVCAVRRLEPAELDAAGVSLAERAHPDYVPFGGVLSGVDQFDPDFFGISAREAELIDPQQRLLLEVCYEALEHGGYGALPDGCRVGVYAGTGMTLHALQNYLLNNLARGERQIDPVTALQVAIGNQNDFAATRVAYRLGLSGPAIGVQTACSTSLVAVHLAAQALLTGDADLVLAGAAAVHVPQLAGYRYVEGSILSPSGRCRAFDASADGTVGGNGAAAVLLKRLDRALADGDTVYAVVLGSAVNNDGNVGKISFTAPSAAGQVNVVTSALRAAGVSPETIGYVETHGTGTRVGDPIEFQALTEAFRTGTNKVGYCALGSVKPNIGHLDSCAGMAGLVKAVLSLRHRTIPPLANYREPNPALDLEASPFYVPTRSTAWEGTGRPRRAGISALGVGGTNAHIILEEAPPEKGAQRRAPGDSDGRYLLPLSARTPQALFQLALATRELLLADPPAAARDVCSTAAYGRRHLEQRLVVSGNSAQELANSLEAFCTDSRRRSSRFVHGKVPRQPRGSLAFVFAGQGGERAGMARALYDSVPVVHEMLDRCERAYADVWGGSLLAHLLGNFSGHCTTDIGQPALFAFQVAIAGWLKSVGVQPALVVGHSAGEYPAFCMAGALTVEDGLHLSTVRGKLMQERTEPGAMVAVLAARPAVEQALAEVPGIDLAVINAADHHVLAGRPSAVEEAKQLLERAGHRTRRLPASRAFHSALLDPMLAEFRAYLAQVPFRPLAVPLVSTATGALLPAGTVPDVDYFCRQTRRRVDFATAVSVLADAGARCLIGLGPDDTLIGIGRRALPDATWIAAQRKLTDPLDALQALVAELHCFGVPLDWSRLVASGRRIALPTYPFERRSSWIDAATPADAALAKETPMESDTHANNSACSAPNESDVILAKVLLGVRELTARQLGCQIEAVCPDDMFFELGADSLLMINTLRELERAYQVRIRMRELFETADTPQLLSRLIVDRMDQEVATSLLGALATDPKPAPIAPKSVATAPMAQPPEPEPAQDVVQAPVTVPLAVAVTTPSAPPALTPAIAGHGYQELINDQLRVMSEFARVMERQLSITGSSAQDSDTKPGPASVHHVPAAEPTVTQTRDNVPIKPHVTVKPNVAIKPSVTIKHGPRTVVPRASGMAARKVTPQQRAHFEDLEQRYTTKTKTSKAITQRYRRVLADSRAIVGFRSATKELLYPIAARRAKGAWLEDVDGNRYLDITMGFGTLLFGHEPDFVTEAVRAYLAEGLRLGPRGVEPGQAAELLAELTGLERVAFANSGTEANSGAIRLARTVTGRNKIVIFDGSYHGHADSVLGRPVLTPGGRETVPVSAGIPQSAVSELIVLDYDLASLPVIEAMAEELAAVVLEPVQSRYPSRRPVEFVQALRQLTAQHGVVLMFDEMLTGLRPHPRGAQNLYGVVPDLATYGKVLGGGFPIGAIAGRADIMDGIDGGFWQYGDDSYPPSDTTFFGGTYIQHPVSMAAAVAVLDHLSNHSPHLQDQLNARTDELAATLNRFFLNEGFPVRIAHFGSLFRFEYQGDLELFFHHLILRGVHVWEWRNFFLSTAHSDADVEFLVQAVQGALRDLRDAGFLDDATGRTTPPAPPPVAVPAHADPAVPPVMSKGATSPPAAARATPAPDFSLYFFGDYPRDTAGDDKYRIVLDSARFADEHGFHAVWLPERHFHSFGGVFPNPSVLAAALAVQTSRIRINAGCVVLPLHHPVRIAEEWSVIDNLSGGRIGLGCASGWHAQDFVFQPENFGRHKDLMYKHLDTIQRLWRGETITALGGDGKQVEVQLYPKPLQEMPPLYTAIVGNPDSYRMAARNGLGVITNLMVQSPQQLAEHIRLYRQERAACGMDPDAGRVVVLLHTYLGTDLEGARAEAFAPFCRYMRSSLSLFGSVTNSLGLNIDYKSTAEEDLEFMLKRAYERYCESRALIGTPDSVTPIVDTLLAAGVNEFACFVDFGASPELVHAGLPVLDQLRRRYQDRGRSAPLSFAQQRIWFHEQLLPNQASYNEAKAVRLEGKLDEPALRWSLAQLVARHEALHTVFPVSDGDVHQVVRSPQGFQLVVEDLTGIAESEVLAATLAQETEHRYDLAEGPLFRVRLLRLAATRHILIIAAHHIIFDTWSATVLTRELSELYRARLACRPPELPALTTTHAQYAIAERAAVDGAMIQKELAYWTDRLGGNLPRLELPTDRPRPAVSSGIGKTISVDFGLALSDEVRSFSRASRATLFMTLAAAFTAMLRHFTGQEDILVGTPVANRPEGTEELVGFFVNTLVLRTDLTGDPSFAELVSRVRTHALDAYDHQQLPFEELLRHLAPERDLTRMPVVQVMIEFENKAILEFDLPGIQATLLDAAVSKSAFDLAFYLTNLPDGIRCQVEYDASLFDEATVHRFVEYFRCILRAGVVAPTTPLSRLFELTAADRELLERVAAPAALPAGPTLIERIERQTTRSPDAPAVVQGGNRLTYGELNAAANRLSRWLCNSGVGCGDVVAVHLPRGRQLLITLLAVLKTGAAYLPTDPDEPAQRCAQMITDAAATVVMTDQSSSKKLCRLQARPLILDQLDDERAVYSEANPPMPADADRLAQVLYTSGSTGRPKGVELPLRGVDNLVSAHLTEFGLERDDRVSWISSPGFDATTLEIWPALAAGACLYVVPDEVRADAVQLQQWLITTEITSCMLTTTLAEQLLDLPWCPDAGPRLLFTGGEQLRRWCPPNASFRLINVYGPTENTAYSTWAEVPTADGMTGLPPIGRPLPGVSCHVLDNQRRPVPIGAWGELYLSGAQLARGYRGGAEQTAARFIPHPSNTSALYRTGDIVRWRNDGTLDFLGRVDDQIKIRGRRVELAEIEAAIVRLATVHSGTVTVRTDSDGRPQLVAYAVITGVRAGTEEELRKQLVDELTCVLPDTLVPKVWVFLDRLPVTINGKVDRAALPAPDLNDSEGCALPSTPLEKQLHERWCAELNLDRIAVDRSFFDLGGHSLSATRLLNRVRAELGVDMPMSTFYRAPTITAMAAFGATNSAATPGTQLFTGKAASKGQPSTAHVRRERGTL